MKEDKYKNISGIYIQFAQNVSVDNPRLPVVCLSTGSCPTAQNKPPQWNRQTGRRRTGVGGGRRWPASSKYVDTWI